MHVIFVPRAALPLRRHALFGQVPLTRARIGKEVNRNEQLSIAPAAPVRGGGGRKKSHRACRKAPVFCALMELIGDALTRGSKYFIASSDQNSRGCQLQLREFLCRSFKRNALALETLNQLFVNYLPSNSAATS